MPLAIKYNPFLAVWDDVDDKFISKHVFHVSLVSFPVFFKAFGITSAIFGRVDKMADLSCVLAPWLVSLPSRNLTGRCCKSLALLSASASRSSMCRVPSGGCRAAPAEFLLLRFAFWLSGS
jgi:hypothetical protein